jgi:ribosomal protein S18 acetylase RimI-like enzyme
MKVQIVNDSNTVFEFLKSKARYDYVYQFSNLEPAQWKSVICYGLFDEGELKAMAMMNMNYDVPVLLAACFDNGKYSVELLKRIKKFLPPSFYTHIDKITLDEVFSNDNISELEEYMNMGVSSDELPDRGQGNETTRLTYEDIDIIKDLISESYPEAWLDDELVKLNENFGIIIDGRLISFAGIHAYSEEYQVAAVAHVTTLPDFRKRGYAEKSVAALTESLAKKIKYIGLNVKTDNYKAINCYKKLGFKEFGRFAACYIENKQFK